MTHPHTLQWHLLEQKYSRVINRDGYDQWIQTGKQTLAERASERVRELLGDEIVDILPLDKKEELRKIMGTHSRSYGFEMSPILAEIKGKP
jgi:trimethylamine:corrinoid methyltransferase-like protein